MIIRVLTNYDLTYNINDVVCRKTNFNYNLLLCPFARSNFSWQLIPEVLIDLYLPCDNDHHLC